MPLQENKSQSAVRQRNLVHLCSYVIKAIIDKDVHMELNDNDIDVANLCAVIEQAVYDGLKVSQTWYGALEKKIPWNFFRMACNTVSSSCISTVSEVEGIQTTQGKTRAFLRMALMEKRLDQYLQAAYENATVCREFYHSDALLCSENASEFFDLIRGLQVIDFSFVLRGQYLDYNEMTEIDLSPYLKYSSGREKDEDGQWQIVSDEATGTDEWKQKYELLEHKHRLLMEQKSYVEEVLRSHDIQLHSSQLELQKARKMLQQQQFDAACHQRQLETVVVELQNQVSSLQQISGPEMGALHSFDNSVPLVNLNLIRDKKAYSDSAVPAMTQISELCSHTSYDTSFSSAERSDVPSFCREDTLSLTKDDTPSLTVFAGSLTSSAIVALREASCEESGDVFINEATELYCLSEIENDSSKSKKSDELVVEGDNSDKDNSDNIVIACDENYITQIDEYTNKSETADNHEHSGKDNDENVKDNSNIVTVSAECAKGNSEDVTEVKKPDETNSNRDLQTTE